MCTSTEGRLQCGCPDGEKLQADGRTCQGKSVVVLAMHRLYDIRSLTIYRWSSRHPRESNPGPLCRSPACYPLDHPTSRYILIPIAKITNTNTLINSFPTQALPALSSSQGPGQLNPLLSSCSFLKHWAKGQPPLLP